MRDGVPSRETATFTDRLFDLVRRNPARSKEKFEDLAKRPGFRRGTIRDFIYNGVHFGRLKYEKCKLFVKPKHAAVVSHPAFLSNDDDELPEPSLVAVVL